MGYTKESGQPLRKLTPTRGPGINQKESHARFITDIEHFVLGAWLRAALHRTPDTDRLAARVLLDGLDWEHFEALMPDDPAGRTAEDIARLDALALATELLAGEIDVRTGVVDRQGNPFPPSLADDLSKQ